MTSIAVDRLDGLSSSTAIKGPCRVATTANIALTGLQTIDGVAVAAGDRVLVKAQTSGAENGIYVVDTGAWRRVKDFNRTTDVRQGTQVFVFAGSTNSATIWAVSTADPISVGTTSITFTLIIPSVSHASVATRTVLKGLDSSIKKTAIVYGEGNRNGTFAFVSGNLSSFVTADSLEGIYVAPTSAPTGASGAWVRVGDWLAKGITPLWFGAAGDGVTNDKNALQAAINLPFPVFINDGKTFLIGSAITIPSTGTKHIFGNGTIQGATGFKLLSATSIDRLVLENFMIHGGCSTGLTAGTSLDGNITLTTCTNVRVVNVKSTNSRYMGLHVLGGSNIQVLGGDYSTNYSAMHFVGVTGFVWSGFKVTDSCLTSATFKTGPQLETYDATYGFCSNGLITGCDIGALGNAQAILAHAGRRISIIGNTCRGSAYGIALGAFSASDDIDDCRVIGNHVDCSTGLASGSITSSFGISLTGHASNIAGRNVISNNTVLNANQDLQDTGSGAIRFSWTQDTNCSDNVVVNSYQAGIIDERSNNDLVLEGNIIRAVDGAGWAYWFRGVNSETTNGLTQRGGIVDTCVTVFRNEALNAAGANTMNIDLSTIVKSFTTFASGFASGIGANLLHVTTTVTSVDLKGLDGVAFAVGGAHSVSTISNAVIGKVYRFIFSNGNTTLARGGAGGGFKCSGGANVVGAANMSVLFKAASATQLDQIHAQITPS